MLFGLDREQARGRVGTERYSTRWNSPVNGRLAQDLHAGDARERESDGRGHQQRTEAEAENGGGFLRISGQA